MADIDSSIPKKRNNLNIILGILLIISLIFLIYNILTYRNYFKDGGIEIPEEFAILQNYIEPQFIMGYPKDWLVNKNEEVSFIIIENPLTSPSSINEDNIETEQEQIRRLNPSIVTISIQRLNIPDGVNTLKKYSNCFLLYGNDETSIRESGINPKLVKINNTLGCKTTSKSSDTLEITKYLFPVTDDFGYEINVTVDGEKSEFYEEALTSVHTFLSI